MCLTLVHKWFIEAPPFSNRSGCLSMPSLTFAGGTVAIQLLLEINFRGSSIKKSPSKNVFIFRSGSVKRTASENAIFKNGCLCQPSLKMSDF
jgi:hypothetical protein